MKRTVVILSLIFALAITLSATVPALAVNPDTTTISGAVVATIDVTAPDDITGGTALALVPGTTVTGSSANGNVKSNKAWTLTVTDLTNGGYMKSVANSSIALGTKFQINVAGGGLRNADTTTPTVTGNKGASNPISFAISQVVLWTDDPAADYQIVITFTGSN